MNNLAPPLIAAQSLKDLVEANAIRHATVIADKDIFKVRVKYGMTERTVSVRTREGITKERVFTSLDAVAKFMLEKVHLAHYEIDAANFRPSEKKAKREDTSERMREAHAAAAYNKWLKAEVQAAIDNPLQPVSNEEAMQYFSGKREALKKRSLGT